MSTDQVGPGDPRWDEWIELDIQVYSNFSHFWTGLKFDAL